MQMMDHNTAIQKCLSVYVASGPFLEVRVVAIEISQVPDLGKTTDEKI